MMAKEWKTACGQKLKDFAVKLRGTSGVSLSRFVLSLMMNEVAAQANKLLEEVHILCPWTILPDFPEL